jgi:hypothetical protein
MRHGVDALLNVALLVFFVLYAVNKGFRDERSRQRARFALPILVPQLSGGDSYAVERRRV